MANASYPANRLARETSPYLRQHAHNPVDWFPWGDEALARARELDRPIFLSIGYSACHWCHVMERESFEDPHVAALLNEHFVSVKVDREERPDLDQIYMAAVQILTQHGGWPMTVFLTPQGRPFYGGTYFPPRDLYGRPSFERVVKALAAAWKEQRDVIETNAEQLSANVQAFLRLDAGAGAPGSDALGPSALRHAGQVLRRRFDARHGGFGAAPKFPHPMDLRLLLRIADRFDDPDSRTMAVRTLEAMARGGIYDQLGGGFHRYSTDEKWLVPHFEKMLYDNALLISACVEAWQATGDPFLRRVTEETGDYVLREMTGPDGGFFSTQDADSEGEEGKFFVWSAREIADLLGDEADFFGSVYDVTEGGNWEGVNILRRLRTDEQDAKLFGLTPEALRTRLAACRATLLAARSRRVWPGRDEKILTAWNGLMIAALADASAALDRPDFLEAARRAADFTLTRMRTPEGRLLRTTFAGSDAKFNGYLEDYAYLAVGLVALFEASFESRWLAEATRLAETMLARFGDPVDGGFFYTSDDHESLLARTKDPHDNATPSAPAMAATALVRLAHLTGRADFREAADRTLSTYQKVMTETPMVAAQMLIALDFRLGPVTEIALVGDARSARYRDLLRAARAGFAPRRLLVGGDGPSPLLADRPAGPEGAAAYVCVDGACRPPIVDPALLRG